ncbi:MAG: SDR family oxidoreductase [Acidimicrobiales bacterium]|nr:SDR family oxidoreductase [Acidimicrobiales bacterium]
MLGSPTTGVVVTGGGSGIGKATCIALASVGRPVSVWDINGGSAKEVADICNRDFGVKSHYLEVDVSDSLAIEQGVDPTVNALGNIGGLVHAAGVPGPGPIDMVDDKLWDSVLDVNLRAGAILTRVFLPALKASGPGSSIVMVSSIEGHVGSGFLTAYCASKAGLLGLTRALSQRLGLDQIRINSVCPGVVETPMMAPLLAIDEIREKLSKQAPLGRVATPEDIAKSIRFLLSDEASFITGTSLIVDGGFIAIGAI